MYSFVGRPALHAALVASAVCAAAGLAGAAVRVLPWAFDPAVSTRVITPFARSIAAVALEAAILVGWPVGWAVAAARLRERGEARALAALGERPAVTAARLLPQAALWMALLGAVSFWGARDASAPGRVVGELLEEARASCASASSPSERTVPFAAVTWLCEPGRPPRLAGHGPGTLRTVAFTASAAHVTGDLRQVALVDARLVLGKVHVAVGSLTLRGLTPWAPAADLGPVYRAVLLATTACGAALVAVYLALLGFFRRPLSAIGVGAAGPLATLAALRGLERAGAAVGWYAAVFPLAIAVTVACAALLSRLPRSGATASK